MKSNYKKLAKNSLVEKRFEQILNNQSIKVISFDIFETIAFRKVMHPTDVFELVGQNKYVKSLYESPYAFKMFRIYAERRARQKSDRDEITLEDIYNELNLTKVQKQRIQKLELKEESCQLYINKQIENWIKKAYKKGKKVILTSDMYLSTQQIDEIILKKFKYRKEISEVYVSSEIGTTKAKQNLFKYIKGDLNIEYTEMAHIGDKIHSDVNMPNALGIKTIHYNINKQFQEVLDLEEKYIQRSLQKSSNLRKLASMLNPYNDKKQQFYFYYGALFLGPIMWEFSKWLESLALQHQKEQINFIMREGKFFQNHYQMQNSQLRTNLVYASRKSTFLAGINEEDLSLKEFNFFKYRTYLIEDIYKLYKLPLDNKLLIEYKDSSIKEASRIYIEEQSLIKILIQDFSSKFDILKTTIKDERKVFLKYLNQLEVCKSSLWVDFGGTGSILKNIDTIKKNDNIYALFYMHDTGYKMNISRNIFSFLPRTEQSEKCLQIIQRSPEFIELLLNGNEQTTVSYKTKKSKIFPVTMFPIKSKKKRGELSSIIEAFNLGVEAYFHTVKKHHFKTTVDRETLLLMLTRCIDVPLEFEAKYLGKLYHDEGRGSAQVVKLITNQQVKEIKRIGLEYTYQAQSKYLMHNRNDYHWLQGVMALIDDKYIPISKGLITSYPNQNYIDEIIRVLRFNKINQVNIYGAGILFYYLELELLKHSIKIESVMDTRAELEPFEQQGYNISSLNNITEDNNHVIIVASVEFSLEITEKLSKYLFENKLKNKLINFDDGLIDNQIV